MEFQKTNPGTEISLFTDERYLQPFDQSRLALVLDELHDHRACTRDCRIV